LAGADSGNALANNAVEKLLEKTHFDGFVKSDVPIAI
jgi:hypothetical protein